MFLPTTNVWAKLGYGKERLNNDRAKQISAVKEQISAVKEFPGMKF